MTTTAPQSFSLSKWAARHPLVFYFFVAFGFSWLMFLPAVLMYYGVVSLSPKLVQLLAIAGLLGPTLSSFMMTALTEDGPGIADLLRRMVCWRVELRWYILAFFALPAAMVLGTLICRGALESFDVSARPSILVYLRAFISMALIGGPLFEEPGWTGFAQPRLQRLHGALLGGLILGSLWAVWHLPGFLIPSQDVTDIPPRGTVLDFVVFALALIGLRLIIIWIVNNARNSVLMAILVHAPGTLFTPPP